MHMNRHTSSTTTVCRNIYYGSTQERYSNTCYLHIWADKLVEKERSLFSMSTPFRENYVVMHQPHKLTGFAQKPHFHSPQSEKEHWNTEEFQYFPNEKVKHMVLRLVYNNDNSDSPVRWFNLALPKQMQHRFFDFYARPRYFSKMDCFRFSYYLATGKRVLIPEWIGIKGTMCIERHQITQLSVGTMVIFVRWIDQKLIQDMKESKDIKELITLTISKSMEELEEAASKPIQNNCTPNAYLHAAIYIGNRSDGEPLYLSKYGKGNLCVLDYENTSKYLSGCNPDILLPSLE